MVLPGGMILEPPVPDWQQALDASASFVVPSPAYAQSPPPGAFATTWETTGANQTITIPVGGATGSCAVHWDVSCSLQSSAVTAVGSNAPGTIQTFSSLPNRRLLLAVTHLPLHRI